MNATYEEIMENNVGVLDPEGKNPNPWNGKIEHSDTYHKMAFEGNSAWTKLEVYNQRADVIKKLFNNDVTVFIAGTGVGKTVLLPIYMMHLFNYKKKIVVSIPKKKITVSAAEGTCKRWDVELGKEIGYRIAGEKKYFNDQTKLLFATNGSIVQMFKKDKLLLDYNCVIIDETHERQFHTDLILYYLKNLLKHKNDRKDKEGNYLGPIKIVIMSATIDPSIFTNYFNTVTNKIGLLEIDKKSNFKIVDHWLKEPIPQMDKKIELGLKIIKNIIKTTDSGDIIMFISTSAQIKKSCEVISETSKYICLKLQGDKEEGDGGEGDEIMNIVNNPYHKRKVIIATNAAESSLNASLKYVIDTGKEFSVYKNYAVNMIEREEKYTSQAQIKQRRGRTGRFYDGICYHLYTKNEFDKLEQFPKPGVLRDDILSEVYQTIWYNVDTNFDVILNEVRKFIEPPPEKEIQNIRDTLAFYNLITPDGNKTTMTEIVKLLMSEKLTMYMVIMLVYSYYLGVYNEVITIIAILNSITGRRRPKDPYLEKYKIVDSDYKYGTILLLLKLYSDGKIKEKYSYRIDRFISEYSPKILENLTKILSKFSSKQGYIEPSGNLDNVLICLYKGMHMDYCKYDGRKMIFRHENDFEVEFNRSCLLKDMNKLSNIVKSDDSILLYEPALMRDRANPKIKKITADNYVIIPYNIKEFADKLNLYDV